MVIEGIFWGCVRDISGIFWDSGQENENYNYEWRLYMSNLRAIEGVI